MGSRRRSWSLAGVVAGCLLHAPDLRAEPIVLDGLLAGIERGCELSKPLGDVRTELNNRYTFEKGTRRSGRVRLPEGYAAAFGRASATGHSDHTLIRVPLTGTYRGLPVRAVTFANGHSNGINVWSVVFGAGVADVRRVVGRDLARTNAAFKADPDTKDFGFSADLIPRGGNTELVCSIST